MLKRILRFANKYWGDIVFYAALPILIMFYAQASRDTLTVDHEFVPVVEKQFAVFMFFLYLVYVVVSLVRIAIFKKRLLRDWCYLIVGSIAIPCFTSYFSPLGWGVVASQLAFLRFVSILQAVSVSLLDARIAIWLYKFFTTDRQSEAIENPSEPDDSLFASDESNQE